MSGSRDEATQAGSGAVSFTRICKFSSGAPTLLQKIEFRCAMEHVIEDTDFKTDDILKAVNIASDLVSLQVKKLVRRPFIYSSKWKFALRHSPLRSA